MQIPRTRHDIRGMCFQGVPLLQGGISATNLLGDAAGGAGSLLGGLGGFGSLFGLQANAGGGGGGQAQNNYGLNVLPVQANFLDPTATSTYNPTIISNPSVTQGLFGNSLIIDPQITGPHTSSSASLFGGSSAGGAGAGGNAGGNISDNINYAPQTTLVSNLPPPLQMPTQNMMNLGNPMGKTVGSVMPMSNSPMGMMMPTTQPIAAGGVSPSLAGLMAMGQQQQLAQPGQQVIPGSASQAGGYNPGQPSPMPQMGQGSPTSMFGATMPTAMQYGLVPPPQPSQAAAAQALQSNPQLQSQQATPDMSGQTLSAGAGRAVSPDQPISQTAQDTIDELERLKGQVSPAAAQAIDNFTKSAAAKLADHQAKKQTLEPKLQQAEAKNEAIVQQAGYAATPRGNTQILEATKNAIYNQKTPAEQAAITRGANRFNRAGSAHPKLRQALIGASFLGNMGIARGARALEARLEAHETKEEARDDKAYTQFLTEVHSAMSEQHAERATELTGADAEMTNYRTQINENDENLRRGIANAKDLYVEPGKLKMEAASKEATMAAQQGAERARGLTESFAGPKLALEAKNAESNRMRALTGQENYQRLQDRAAQDKTKQGLEIKKLQDAAAGNQWTGKFAGLKPSANMKLDQYQDSLYEEVKAGRLDPQTAKEANRKAKLILKEE